MLFERTALSRKPEETIRNDLEQLRQPQQVSPDILLKDPYILDFLDLRDRFAAIPFEDKSGTWEARYYQHNAIKHVLEAIYQRYIGKQQKFLDFILEQYIKAGVGELDRTKLPQLLELKYHTVRDAVEELGSVANISAVFIGFQQYLYSHNRVA
ncbi:type I restriction-modification enzyme R subunit C-terminal domain-containing protein [Atlanticothrix silvestris]|uniref:type I restriction-modification enzyme R subunit C-terminal domain-containing protein n=1 Tax=Atlanticothrix silvestris TaxID=2840444 RepID=UPI00384C9EC6